MAPQEETELAARATGNGPIRHPSLSRQPQTRLKLAREGCEILVTIIPKKDCQCCQVEQAVSHIPQDCPLLDQLRRPDNMARGGDGSAEAVGMSGGAAEDVPICLVLGTASVTAIEKKKKIPKEKLVLTVTEVQLCVHESTYSKIWIQLEIDQSITHHIHDNPKPG